MRHLFLAFVAAFPCPVDAQDLASFAARGNEPFWSLDITLSDISFTRAGDKGVATWPLPPVEFAGDDRRYAVPGGPVITIARTLCRDSMSGMPFPATVTVATGDETLSGCGGDSALLLTRTEWRLTAIDGAPLPADITRDGTLTFDATGAVSGTSFCNRFTGPYTLTGEGISFGAIAGTRMACAEPLAGLEAAMLAALARVTRFDMTEDGSLLLLAGDSPALTATPLRP